MAMIETEAAGLAEEIERLLPADPSLDRHYKGLTLPPAKCREIIASLRKASASAAQPLSGAPDGAGQSQGRVDAEMQDFLDGVVGVVDANSFEYLMLWEENNRSEHPRPWRSNLSGLMEIVGHLADMPVCISLRTAKVCGHKLLFLDATSQVVDHRMIDEWLKRTCPASAFRENGFVNRTDAMNFYNIFPRGALSTHPNDRAQSDIAPPSAGEAGAEANTKSPAIASAKGAEDDR